LLRCSPSTNYTKEKVVTEKAGGKMSKDLDKAVKKMRARGLVRPKN
jgi:hypothetical protein